MADGARRVPAQGNRFTVLGTLGGPTPHPSRGQPAYLLTVDGVHSLVDMGDGAAHRLAAVGVLCRQIERAFVSHLHGDHFGGLFAIMALRLQTNSPKPLMIYGAPGTARMVEGLLDALEPAMEAGYGMPGAPRFKRDQIATVEELRDGDVRDFPGFRLTVCRNNHYSFEPGAPEYERYQSLSMRFDLVDRAIVYTGDTGRSEAVERLAAGCDLLVGEVIDIDDTLAGVLRQAPDLPEKAVAFIRRHLTDHHLAPDDLGRLATAARAKHLLVAHIATGSPDRIDPAALTAEIGRSFAGRITVANDYDVF
ncbi:MAG TPA: MBL fold metallo-hydrolase [Rhizobiales bacterium]|nr:MBL fold metallo-hydrolase [Hyphomicrobiales bacterium]